MTCMTHNTLFHPIGSGGVMGCVGFGPDTTHVMYDTQLKKNCTRNTRTLALNQSIDAQNVRKTRTPARVQSGRMK